MKKDNQLRIFWLFVMAWRDSRRNRSRLLLFISSIIIGMAALVATLSFAYNLREAINGQAKTLVGADLVIESNRPVSIQIQSALDSPANAHSQECNFASMIYFTKTGNSRLVQVRALDGDYPFYGALGTVPVLAGSTFRNGKQALVDKTLMLQFGAQVGDSIKIGELTFAIAGELQKAPGRNEISTTVAPPVYIPLRYLPQTDLIQKGSRIQYSLYYRYDSMPNVEAFVSSIEPRLRKEGLNYETVESRKKRTGRTFQDYAQFLTLISFIALLLGCMGVASAIHIYMREKINSIAIMRCLGVKGWQAFLIYLIQVAGIGLAGSIIGAAVGTALQQILPAVFKDFLPLETKMSISWMAIGQGMAAGMTISMLFALLPLLSIRNISPLYTLRISYEPIRILRDPLNWLLYAAILFFIIAFSQWQTHSWRQSIIFAGSVFAAFLVLALVARILMWFVRRFFPASMNYLWRQGFANLFRPNNQTLILVITIGLGSAFIGTLYFVQSMLINRVSASASTSEGNMVLFDIQTGQQEAVVQLLGKYKLPVLQKVPIVTMRFEEIKGIRADQAYQDSADRRANRAFRAELRVTYRDSSTASEKIIAGKMGTAVKPGEPIYISLEEEYASRLRVKIGDTIIFNVQGVLVTTMVGSQREVDWRHLQTNFRIVFPSGVLESAPQFHVLVTRVPSADLSARFQQAIVQNFPNISVIDLGLILSVLNEVLDKISFVIRFMAGFSMMTGIVVLMASLLISKYQRIQESLLLRTLGASRRQILIINLLEYFFLGALAAGTGILLSLAGSWALAKYSFDIAFSPRVLPVLILFGLICSVTILIGLLNGRAVLNKPPLEILRTEG